MFQNCHVTVVEPILFQMQREDFVHDCLVTRWLWKRPLLWKYQVHRNRLDLCLKGSGDDITHPGSTLLSFLDWIYFSLKLKIICQPS